MTSPPPSNARPIGMLALLSPLTAGVAATALLAGALWITPASPLILGRIDGAVGNGYAASAAEELVDIGRTSPRPTIRRAALERAAQVYALELNQPAQARLALKLLLARGTEPTHEAAVRERIAELMLQERDVAGAAAQYKRAWLANPKRPSLLNRSAELHASIGHIKQARNTYRTLLNKAPAWSAQANLGLGQLALTNGRATAGLRPFQKAIRSGSPEIKAAARLGLAACYERLGELEGALAEIEQSDLPEPVRVRRQQALRDRAIDIRN